MSSIKLKLDLKNNVINIYEDKYRKSNSFFTTDEYSHTELVGYIKINKPRVPKNARTNIK